MAARRDRTELTVEPAVAPPPGNPRFPLVDSMRAIAVLGVVFYHLEGEQTAWWWGDFTARLNVGVTIFFLISGFLLYRPYVAARAGGRPGPSLARFARRRALRIVPAYWLVLSLYALLLGGSDIVWSDQWWVFYGFGQLYSPETIFQGIAPAWTLCVEITFYAVLPFYAMAIARLLAGRERQQALRWELGALAALSLGAIAFRTHFNDGVTPLTLPGMFAWFALGMALAVFSVAPAASRPLTLTWIARRPLFCWLLALIAYWAVSTRAGLPPNSPSDPPLGPTVSTGALLAEHVLYAVVALFLLLPAVFFDEAGGLPRRVLRLRSLAWIGLVSYGIFLWHGPIFTSLGGSGLFLGTVGLALVVVIAAMSYYLVERPLLALKDPGRPDIRRWLPAWWPARSP